MLVYDPKTDTFITQPHEGPTHSLAFISPAPLGDQSVVLWLLFEVGREGGRRKVCVVVEVGGWEGGGGGVRWKLTPQHRTKVLQFTNVKWWNAA